MAYVPSSSAPGARARLALLVAPTSAPVLSDAELDMLLEDVRRTDPAGRAPGSAGWEPTYDLHRAARRAWEMKAGRAADGYAFGTDGQTFNRDQVFEHCMAMAKLHRRAGAASGSVTLEGAYPTC